jgi:hypothetical protein
MDFSSVVGAIDTLLGKYQPLIFNSSWIKKHAPKCYCFIRKNVREEFGGIDWDRLTCALDRKFQKLWTPARRKNPVPYGNQSEVDTISRKYRDKLYVFLTPLDKQDRRIRDLIAVKFVRLAQNGNFLARQKLLGLVRHTIDGWIDRDYFISRWRGYEDDLQKQVEACIRRYRYTGSFVNYLFRTLACAARGIRPPRFYSLEIAGLCEHQIDCWRLNSLAGSRF